MPIVVTINKAKMKTNNVLSEQILSHAKELKKLGIPEELFNSIVNYAENLNMIIDISKNTEILNNLKK